MGAKSAPPIWILILIQAASVIGDSFGQRVSRVNFKGSRRHMMLGLCIMSCLQMLIILGILQLALPVSLTGAVYVNGEKINCTTEICNKINGTNICHQELIECKSQGPFSMFQSIYRHPLLLVNGVLNIAYYTGETMLYREPLGLIFLVIASLTSTFLINPMLFILRQPVGKPIPAAVLVLGIIGALLCVIERQPKKEEEKEKQTSINDASPNEATTPLLNDTPAHQNPAPSRSRKETAILMLKSTVRIIIPFLLLSVTYATWFVIQDFVNNDFHVNAFGYNSLDQGLLPFYVIPYLLIVSFIKPMNACYENDNSETFIQAFKNTWKESSLINLFMYRLFINGRAIAYFLLAVNYDLGVVYLELTLIRVIESWLGAIVLCLLIPKFIGTTPEEKKATFSPLNIVMKFIGTAAITTGLVLLNTVYKNK